MSKRRYWVKLRDERVIGMVMRGKVWHIERYWKFSLCGLNIDGLRALWRARPSPMRDPLCNNCLRIRESLVNG